MGTCIPIYLEGDSLGLRHRYYNDLVRTAVDRKTVLETVLQTPEQSPIDRLFKIDLASEHRHVGFVLQNLKDDNLLYVSRALKCLWLLDPQYADIINPAHLASSVFPHMIQTAVNKTIHWLQLHLKDSKRCQEFYEYYKSQFHIAIKFLNHCSEDFMMKQLIHIMDKMKPKHLKLLCEKCPQICKVYMENLHSNKTALSNYVAREKDFFKSFKQVLKLDGNLYLDIIEKYYNVDTLGQLNPSATRYIMKRFPDRFNGKPELYTRMFLHMKTLAKLLTAEQAKELVVRLGRAEYLASWFTYQNVEPLIKRLKTEERASFKKAIFVEKSVGATVKEWPYSIPTPFKMDTSDYERFFVDKEHYSGEYEIDNFELCKMGYCSQSCRMFSSGKSPLDVLFNHYRFKGFERTFEELSKKMLTESSTDGRLNILLVLVSKSGGVPEQTEKLLKWLIEKHINEPINLRAAVIRSLVKRGCVWRLPEKPWSYLLEFGRDLGLEGQTAELLCREGLHAVVIRQLISDAELSAALTSAFLNEFSTLYEYKLNAKEKPLIGKRIASIMVKIKPNYFLDILAEYRLNIGNIPDAMEELCKSAQSDPELVRRLFDARIGRRELLRVSFPLIQDDASYMNVLRHDISLLEHGKAFSDLVTKERPYHDRFLKSLSIYFNEPNGLAARHKALLEERVATNLEPKFARPICILSSETSLLEYLSNFNAIGECDKKRSQLLSSLRANAHETTPALNVNKVDWRWIGAKAVANRVFICRSTERTRFIESSLQWKRTARIALHVESRSTPSIDTFTRVSSVRPVVALKFSLRVYFKRNFIEPEIWSITKRLIESLNASKINDRLLQLLSYNKFVPDAIKGEYWVVIFNLCLKIDTNKSTVILCRLEIFLLSVEEKTIESVINKFISSNFSADELKNNRDDNAKRCLYMRIIAKYLLMSKSESEQKRRLDTICDALFDKLELNFDTLKDNENLTECLDDFMLSLKYNKAFLSEQYVSCVPVFERVVMRLKKLVPMEQYFSQFIKIHLTMLYYKSVKQSMKQKPALFTNLEQTGGEAMAVVGYVFGNYIGHEIKELVSRYFFSIVDIYKEELVKYMSEYFEYSDKRSKLVVSIINGLLKTGQTEALLLAEHLLHRKYEFSITSPELDEILKILKNQTQEITLFVFANNYCEEPISC